MDFHTPMIVHVVAISEVIVLCAGSKMDHRPGFIYPRKIKGKASVFEPFRGHVEIISEVIVLCAGSKILK